MDQNISILFFPRIVGKIEKAKVPIYLRITISGLRMEQTTNRFVERAKWSSEAGRLKGNTIEAKSINSFLDTLKNKIHNLEKKMIEEDIEINYQNFKEKWNSAPAKVHSVLEVFKNHNEELALLVGKDFAPATLNRYKTSLSHTRDFIQWKYQKDDIEICKINYEFISSYSLWLKTVRNCNHNSSMKYLGNFKKIVHICLKNEWISRDPFIGFKLNQHEVDKPFLSKQELQDLIIKEYSAGRLNYVKDIFVFCCYTGLAYVDVQKLNRSEIEIGLDGEKWICTKRQKTDTPSRIPLLKVAEDLINKYKDHPQSSISGKLFPVFSNQKMNAYLKEIADTCGITKNLTFHIARHTFATIVTLSNGVPIESVSKMLGHKSIRTTQHYAKVLDLKVSADMMELKKKLGDRI